MFKLVSTFKPTGDQPRAIKKILSGLEAGQKKQTLLGITGSGKTFTMASIIEKANLPTLIISPNKTLASQLYQEFKEFFPENAVHYFVSYYDYYQPEAYIPQSKTYIQKDARINEEIDKLRHAAIQSVLSKKDTIVIASVSCIYGIGDPNEYQRARLELKLSQTISLIDLSRHLNYLQYEKTTEEPKLGQFKITANKLVIHLVTGELLEIYLNKNKIKNIGMIGQEVVPTITIYPAKFWVAPQGKLKLALRNIRTEMEERVEELQSANKFEEAERLEKRVLLDLEMLDKKGYVNGIENYSRHLGFRKPGE